MIFCWIRLSGNASSIRTEVIAAHVSTLAQYRIFKPTTLCRIHDGLTSPARFGRSHPGANVLAQQVALRLGKYAHRLGQELALGGR